MKTLIVDDEIVSRKKLQKIMEYLCDCVAVESGEEALREAMGEKPPDLILLDIIMPGMTGYEVLGRLKDDPRTRDIPVIFLSAMGDKEDVIRGLQGGAVDYISKPFHAAEVKARVLNHLNLKKTSEDLKARTITLDKQLLEILEKTEQLQKNDLQLAEMARTACIGTLTAGIALEIDNLLSSVSTDITSLSTFTKQIFDLVDWCDKADLPSGLQEAFEKQKTESNLDSLRSRIPETIQSSGSVVERMKKILLHLTLFSDESDAFQEADINRILDSVLEIMHHKYKNRIEIVKDFGELPPVECMISRLSQVFMNILENACHAIEDKGEIRLMTRRKQGKAIIEISDNGPGIPEEIRKKIFEPFFTTKASDKATGLGLSVSHCVIKKLQGSLSVKSEPGKGTTFIILVPIKAAPQ